MSVGIEALFTSALDNRYEDAERLTLLHQSAELYRGPLARPESAIEAYQAALEIDPTDAVSLDALSEDYVRTARAKGLAESVVLFRHVLKNAMIPILTGVVVVIPLLFMGSLLSESFFGIPGLGSYTIDAIQAQDFAVVRSMVFIGSVLYILGLLLTDLSYTLVDPRIKLQ